MLKINDLINIPLVFEDNIFSNVFKNKNNKTLKETIQAKPYLSLQAKIDINYSKYLDMPIGEFLYKLKQSNDNFYKNFLNPNGDLKYSTFYIEDKKYHDLKGVYFYFVNDEIKYIGRCKDSMKKRVNSGYGKISPMNCFKDGQSTNCKVNAKITKLKLSLNLKLLRLDDNDEIKSKEHEYINKYNPEWNYSYS